MIKALANAVLWIVVCASACAAPGFGIFQVAQPAVLIGWNQLQIGGGGFVDGINQSADGVTLVSRTDVYGCYVSSGGGKWKQVINANSIPSSIFTAVNWPETAFNGRDGCYEIVVAPTDHNRIYAIWYGDLLVSTDQGNTFNICPGWTQIDLNTSGGNTQQGSKAVQLHMAVDPANENLVYVGTPKAGMFRINNGCSTTGGITSLSPGTIPTAGADGGGLYSGYAIAFDSSGGTTGGNTNNIYIALYGNQVYVSTNAGSTFAATSGGPTTVYKIISCPNGTIWDIGATSDYTVGGNANVWKYSSSTWSRFTAAALGNPNQIPSSVACDPNNSNHVVIADEAGALDQTTNGGTTWSGPFIQECCIGIVASDVPWLAWQWQVQPLFLSNGALIFDAVVANKLWQGAGIGVWYTTGFSTSMSVPNVQATSSSGAVITTASAHGFVAGQQVYFNSGGSLGSNLSPNTVYYVIAAGLGATTFEVSATSGGSAITPTVSINAFVNANVTWTSLTAGIENQVGLGTCPTPNGGGSIEVETEQLFFNSTSPLRYPANGIPSQAETLLGASWDGLLSGWSCDYAAANPNFIAGLENNPINGNQDTSGSSIDAGVTWTTFGAAPSTLRGGSIAVSTTSNILVLPAGGATGPYVTTNAGTSWSLKSISGASSGWGSSAFANFKIACADKTNSGTFYLMNTGANALYVSTDSGATFAKATGTGLAGNPGDNAKLVCVPPLGSVGTAGHLLWSPSNSNGSGGNNLYFSSNQGASWVTLANVTNIFSVGVGKPKPGGNDYPVILIIGMVNSVYGIWRCDDYNSSNNTGCNSGNWVNVGTWPAGNLDFPNSIDGDYNTYNRAYTCHQGSGCFQYNFLLRRDIAPASNDNSPVWLSKVG